MAPSSTSWVVLLLVLLCPALGLAAERAPEESAEAVVVEGRAERPQRRFRPLIPAIRGAAGYRHGALESAFGAPQTDEASQFSAGIQLQARLLYVIGLRAGLFVNGGPDGAQAEARLGGALHTPTPKGSGYLYVEGLFPIQGPAEEDPRRGLSAGLGLSIPIRKVSIGLEGGLMLDRLLPGSVGESVSSVALGFTEGDFIDLSILFTTGREF